MTLTDFLLARIAEDEVAATYLRDQYPDETGPSYLSGNLDDVRVTTGFARVLAECETKRRLLTFVLEHGATVDGEYGCCHDADALMAGGRVPEWEGDDFDPLPSDCPGIKAALEGLSLLALPYADHPDYRDRWRP